MLVSKTKKLLLASFMLGMSIASTSAYAGGVAVVDMRSVVEGSKHFAQMQADMQKNLGTKHEELMSSRNDLNKEQENLKKQKSVMAANDFKKKQDELTKKQAKLGERERAFQEEVMKTQDDSMKKLYAAVRTATEKVAKKNGFDLVLQGEPLFAVTKFDITSSVKKELESKKSI